METKLECYICGDEIKETDNIENKLTILKCGHKFHYKCIWLSYKYTKNKKCPYCRQDGGILNSNIKYCNAIIASGKNKGNICNCKIKDNNNIYCGKHKNININI